MTFDEVARHFSSIQSYVDNARDTINNSIIAEKKSEEVKDVPEEKSHLSYGQKFRKPFRNNFRYDRERKGYKFKVRDSKFEGKCNHCGAYGHKMKDCRRLKFEKFRGKKRMSSPFHKKKNHSRKDYVGGVEESEDDE